MFLYSDIVQAPKHQYIVVSVDDSNSEDIQYSLIRDTRSNRKAVLDGGSLPHQRIYRYSARALEYVESI